MFQNSSTEDGLSFSAWFGIPLAKIMHLCFNDTARGLPPPQRCMLEALVSWNLAFIGGRGLMLFRPSEKAVLCLGAYFARQLPWQLKPIDFRMKT